MALLTVEKLFVIRGGRAIKQQKKSIVDYLYNIFIS